MTNTTPRPPTTTVFATAYVGRGVKVHQTFEQVTADGRSYGLHTLCGAEGRGPRQSAVRRVLNATPDCARCGAERAKVAPEQPAETPAPAVEVTATAAEPAPVVEAAELETVDQVDDVTATTAATSIAPRLTPAQAAVVADFRHLTSGALTDPAKLNRWRAGREPFGTLHRTGDRWGETLGRRSFRGGPLGEVQATVSFDLLEACRVHLLEVAPDLVRQLADARIDHLIALAPIITRTATPADRARQAAAVAQLAHLLGLALAHLTPAGAAVHPRRPAPQADPAEIELEHAAHRTALDAAIVEDMLTGELEPYVAEDQAEHGRGRYTGPLPICPEASCRATGKRCKRPSGHDATQWHARREDALARLCKCEVCLAWLARRGQKLDDYRAEPPVQLVGTLAQLARHGQAVAMNDRTALVTPRDGGKIMVAEILPEAPSAPAVLGDRGRQLAIFPLGADEDGAQLDLFEAVAQAELELAGGAA